MADLGELVPFNDGIVYRNAIKLTKRANKMSYKRKFVTLFFYFGIDK